MQAIHEYRKFYLSDIFHDQTRYSGPQNVCATTLHTPDQVFTMLNHLFQSLCQSQLPPDYGCGQNNPQRR